MSANNPDDLAADLAAMVERIWKAKGMPASIDKKITSAFAKELWSGTTKGYGKDLIGIAYDSPDYEMLKKLQNSVYQFSAAKNYQQLKSLTQALIGDDGKLRTYSQFKNAAFQINDTHVNQWLKTEYDTAIASGQMASKWVDIKNNSSTTMLQFDAVMDGHTSQICSSLNGVIRPVDDPFWKQYYPPNHFGCRSTVRQRSGGKATPEANIVYPEKVPPMFKVNLALEGLVFPDGHPYFNHVPENALMSFGDANFVKVQHRSGAGDVYESGMSLNIATAYPKQYSKGKHEAARESLNEYHKRMDAANVLANHFNKDVFVMPEGMAKDDWRFYYFFKGTSTYGKCPDYKIDGKFWDLKTYTKWNKNKISRIISRTYEEKQSDRIIIKMTDNIPIDKVFNKIKGKLIEHEEAKNWIKEIIIIDNNNKVHPYPIK